MIIKLMIIIVDMRMVGFGSCGMERPPEDSVHINIFMAAFAALMGNGSAGSTIPDSWHGRADCEFEIADRFTNRTDLVAFRLGQQI